MSDDAESPDLPQTTLTPEDLKRISTDLELKIEQLSVEHSFQMIRSPLLPPEILAQYEQAVPGLAQKLVDWTEAETAHRHDLEARSFEETKTLRSRAQLAGAAVSVAGIVISGVVGVYSAENGSFAGALVASAIAIVSVGGPLAARIMAGRWSRKNVDSNDE